MTVLVTGSSRGIGAEIARAFAEQKYSVAINYNNSRASAEKLALELQNKYDISCRAFHGNVADSVSVREMFNSIRAELGEIDVLINNAGVSSQKLFTDITDDDWKQTLGVSLDGAFYCSREALPPMIRKKSGVIINISSMWGETGASCEVHYSAAKAGVIGLTKALAKETALSGIRVNCVAPGVITTDMMKGFNEEALEELRQETPLQRLGTPRDIAEAVLFLASERASFITGQILGVNGGFVI